MELSQLKYVSEELAQTLADDGLTVEDLATANPKKLARYPGVGLVTARRIIAGAQKMVNEHELFASGQAEAPPPARTIDVPAEGAESPDPPASVRVQRIRDAHRRGELI